MTHRNLYIQKEGEWEIKSLIRKEEELVNSKKTKQKIRTDSSKQKTYGRKLMHWFFVMMFMLQLLLPIGIQASSAPEGNDQQESTALNLSTNQTEDVDEETPEGEPAAKEEVSEPEDQKNNEAQPTENETPEQPVEEPTEKEEEPTEKEEEPTEKEEEPNKQPPASENHEETPDEPNSNDVEEVEEESEEENTEEEIEEDEGIPLVLDSEEYGDGVIPAGILALSPLFQFKKGSLGSAEYSARQMSAQNTINSNLAPGEVRTSKKATPVPGMEIGRAHV